MSGRMTEQADPFQLVERGAVIEGVYGVPALSRVRAAVYDSVGEFTVRLEFRPDAAWHAVIVGRLTGTVTLQCQRCLEAMAIDLDIRPHLGLCTSEAEVERLPDELEPLLAGDAPLNIREVVEDEILLALPIVARHARPCGQVPVTEADDPADEDARRPFSDLRKMLDGGE